MPSISIFSKLAILVACALTVAACAVHAQERVDGAIQKRGFFGQSISPDEFVIIHGSEFKGASKIAISVFNVAFPNENHYAATTRGSSVLGGFGTSAKVSLSTTMKGVDPATQQRIADKAYALFVEQLKAAGYEVVDQAELLRLAPEFGTWEALPNFSSGRFGAYVAPTGRSVRFLPGDTAKRDISGFMGQQMSAFRALDRTVAFSRSPYIAHDGDIGVIAVTLVVDYGVYSSSGNSNKLWAGASVGFKTGATIAAGDNVDHGTLIEYWGPRSGGFPAVAYLQKPVISDKAFGPSDVAKDDGSRSASMAVAIVADAEKFEAAADEVVGIAVPKLVGVMAAGK